jgi:hypothetical protein
MEAELFYLLAHKLRTMQPAGRASISAAFEVSSSSSPTTTNIYWSTATFTYNGISVSSSGLTVPIAGYYAVSGTILFSSVSGTLTAPISGSLGIAQIVESSTVIASGSSIEINDATNYYSSLVSDVVYLAAGATITLAALASAPSGNVYAWGDSAANDTYLSVIFINA